MSRRYKSRDAAADAGWDIMVVETVAKARIHLRVEFVMCPGCCDPDRMVALLKDAVGAKEVLGR